MRPEVRETHYSEAHQRNSIHLRLIYKTDEKPGRNHKELPMQDPQIVGSQPRPENRRQDWTRRTAVMATEGVWRRAGPAYSPQQGKLVTTHLLQIGSRMPVLPLGDGLQAWFIDPVWGT